MNKFTSLMIIFVFLGILGACAGQAYACAIQDRACILNLLEQNALAIDHDSWRDQTLREYAKTLASDNQYDKAIAVIDQIKSPDTQALTIRGIGMAVAEHGLDGKDYHNIFTKLRARSDKITHPPSYAIALTYIAMAQAFADDDEGAWKTALDMENDALRHKAFGETAEIQAEKGKYKQAMTSITYIESEAYRNKAYSITSKLFADAGHLQDALNTATQITNAYKQANALQYVLDIQKPRELDRD